MIRAVVSQSPLVSILISNYNYAQFLREAIDSALGQTYPHTEVIVVDDGSTDGSREIIASYGDRIVPLFKENGGHASATNVGFAASKGDLICLLDSDDLFFPKKVALVLEAWKNSPSSCVVYHQLQTVDARREKYLGKPSPRAVWSGDIRDRVERSGGWWPYPTTSGLSFSRSFMEQLLPIPTEIRLFPDTYLAGPAAFVAPVAGVPAVLGLVRNHGRNTWNAAANVSEGRAELSRRRAEQYAVEFSVLQETLHQRLNISTSISLEDVWPYQRCRWASGEALSLPRILSGLLGCPSLPLSMKWREAAKALLKVRDWRRDVLLPSVSFSKKT